MKSSCCNVWSTDSDRLVGSGICGLVGCFYRKPAWSRVKLTPSVFRKVVDEEVVLLVCVHVDDLDVAAKDKEAFDVFYTQRLKGFPMNDMGDLSWYLGCALERDKAKGVVKLTQTAFVDSLAARFDIQYELQTLAFCRVGSWAEEK